MADTEEMVVSGLRVQIDRSLCVGFGDCVSEAPEAFRLDDEDLAVFVFLISLAASTLLGVLGKLPGTRQ